MQRRATTEQKALKCCIPSESILVPMKCALSGDINGDGRADLVYIAPIVNGPLGVFIALGDGYGGFATPVFYAVPSFLGAGQLEYFPTISSLHLADVNHDGKADLIYSYTDTDYKSQVFTVGTAVQLGHGDNTFQPVKTIPYYSGVTGFIRTSKVAGPDIMRQILSGTEYAPISVADMNGDGIPDIVALGSSSSYNLQVAVSLGLGDGTFKTPILKTYAAQALNSEGLAVADFNADGKLDVAVTDPFVPAANGLSFGNGDGTLSTSGPTTAALPNQGIFLQVGGATVALDLNGDGKPDIISGSVELLAQNTTSSGSADFALTASSASGTIVAGNSATTTLSLARSNGFAQNVTLSCSGLPTLATCSFSPAAVTLGASAVTSTLTIVTTAKTAMNLPTQPLNPLIPESLLLVGLGLGGIPIGLTQHRTQGQRRRGHSGHHGRQVRRVARVTDGQTRNSRRHLHCNADCHRRFHSAQRDFHTVCDVS